jgi:hypothetical protein
MFFMKTVNKRGLYVVGFALVSALFISNHTTSVLDFKSAATAADSRFDFRYSGVVNTGNEVMPLVGQLSKDGNKLYFTSQNMRGNKQLYVMGREKAGDTFGKPTRLSGVGNDEGYDIVMPSLNGDESTMVFVSSTDGTQKGNDLYIAEKAEGGFINIRTLDEVNDATASDSYPWLSKDGLRLYFTKQKGSSITFFSAERASADAKFSTPVKLDITVKDVNNNMSCYLTNDEKEIFILSGDRIYSATRNTTKEKFGEPVEIAAANNNNGFMNGIALTDNKEEMYVFNSVGFRNTQILKFENAATKKAVKPSIENKTLQIK